MASSGLLGYGLILVLWFLGSHSLPHGEVTTPELLPAPDGKVTLRFSALGEQMSFLLSPDDEFLVPGLHIRHLGRGGVEEEGTTGLRNCFYSSQEPLAAFSVCKGIQGAFLKGRERFIIQPLKEWTGDGTLGQHLVMKAHRLGRKTDNQKEDFMTPKQSQQDRMGAERLQSIPQVSANSWRSELSLQDDTVQHGRHRRFVSEERFVEILLVADVSMVRFYGEDLKVRTRILFCLCSMRNYTFQQQFVST